MVHCEHGVTVAAAPASACCFVYVLLTQTPTTMAEREELGFGANAQNVHGQVVCTAITAVAACYGKAQTLAKACSTSCWECVVRIFTLVVMKGACERLHEVARAHFRANSPCRTAHLFMRTCQGKAQGQCVVSWLCLQCH